MSARNHKVFCFEALDLDSPLVAAAERLYLATQHPDERIPWGWIARSIKGRATWRPGRSGSHLLVATPGESADPAALAGFAYGLHLPGFGGYLCYVGVADGYRRRGVGTRLFDQMAKVLAADAGAADEPLPFVVWESRRPTADAPEADWKLWDARVRLFDKAGGLWLDGVELHAPNYGDDAGPPVTLQLFLKPVDHLARALDGDRLRQLVGDLLTRVYRLEPGDRLYDATLPPGCKPRLRPARDAGRRRKLAAV
jgi:ribosomal protein S18 acetylase RimI-like enzyme